MPPIANPKRPDRETESGHNAYRLVERILALSCAVTWDEASEEWALLDVFYADRDEPGTCLCGHFPIVENCVLVNRQNGNQAIVGNVCVKRFLGLPSGRLFQGISRVTQNRGRSLNAEMIEHAYGRGWINHWERTFYRDTMRKRKLSDKQRAKRVEINSNVLARVAQATTRGRDGRGITHGHTSLTLAPKASLPQPNESTLRRCDRQAE